MKKKKPKKKKEKAAVALMNARQINDGKRG